MALSGAGAYGGLLRMPGVPRMAVSGLVLGIAGTMAPVSFVLFAHRATGSFATASIVLAASTVGGLLAAPFRGRLIDRIGPSAAILRLALPSAATDVAFILAGHARASAPVLVAVAFVAGAIIAPSTAAVRSVWSELLAGHELRQAGYALIGMLQEAAFAGGPLLAGAMIALWSTTAAVAATAGLSLVGGLAFATAPATRRRAPQGRRPRERLATTPGMLTVLMSAAAFGATFGALDVAFPAFARDHGSAAAAGGLLAALAAGIGSGSFLTGLRPPARSAGHRYAPLCGLAAAGLLPLITTPGLGAMVALALLAGLCFAPVTTAQIAVLDEVAPAERPAEAFAWLAILYGGGSAAGAALGGQLVDASGPRAAIVAACAATVAAWLLTTARAGTLSARPAPP
jgi:MFS family permease